MKKSLITLACLLFLVGAAVAQVGSSKWQMAGKYFVSIEGTAGTAGTMIRFPKPDAASSETVAAAGASKAVVNINYIVSGACDITVYSDACPTDSCVVDIPAWFTVPAGGWLPSFTSNSIDSIRIVALSGTIDWVVWGIE